MKKLFKFFTAISLILLFSFNLRGQNCKLINSATFTVPDSSNVILSGALHRFANDTVPLNLNQWNYVAMVIGTNQYQIYLNGKLAYQGIYSSSGMSWNQLHLGAHYYTDFGGWFDGWIDELRISNTVRSATTISNYYSSGVPFSSDANTVGLWHFDQTTGTQINSAAGPAGTISNAQWDSNGKFGSSLYFNGTNALATMNMDIPINNMSCEFWIKPHTLKSSYPVEWYGMNTSGMTLNVDTINVEYTWSTGAKGKSVTVNPKDFKYIWVSNGTCKDTVFFDSKAATVYDTVLVSVTDTLVIDAVFTGINPPNNVNTIKIYPNPAKDHITIDYGNYTLQAGYTLSILNALGQVVYTTPINQQQTYVDLSSWTARGIYYVHLIDAQNKTVEVRKIILQ